jgi:hypothetical protein
MDYKDDFTRFIYFVQYCHIFSEVSLPTRGYCAPYNGQVSTQGRQSAKPFLQSSELGLPAPLTRRSVPPPPTFGSGGRGTIAGESGGWESPNSDEGTYTVVLCRYMYFVGQ